MRDFERPEKSAKVLKVIILTDNIRGDRADIRLFVHCDVATSSPPDSGNDVPVQNTMKLFFQNIRYAYEGGRRSQSQITTSSKSAPPKRQGQFKDWD